MARKKKVRVTGKDYEEITHRLMLGPEPMIKGPFTWPVDVQLEKLFSWYGSFYRTDKDRCDLKRETVDAYVRKSDSFTDEEKQLVYRADNVWCHISSCVKIRLMNRDEVFPEQYIKSLDRNIHTIIQRQREKEAEAGGLLEDVAVKDNKRIMADQASGIILHINFMIDCWTPENVVFDAYKYLQRIEAKPYIAKALVAKFSPLMMELEEACRGKDPDLKEAYRHLTKANLNSFAGFISSIVTDSERYAGNVKAAKPKKPRVRRAKTADQIVKRLRYQKEFPSLKLASVNPTQIVGARELWVYNTKYKQLARYVATGEAGLTLKGSTLLEFDEKRSVRRALRKPEKTLSDILGSLRPEVIYTALKTKESAANGRINNDTVLLKVKR